MNSSKIDEILKKVFEDLRNMSPEEFRAELDKHKYGDVSKALIEIRDFYFENYLDKKENKE